MCSSVYQTLKDLEYDSGDFQVKALLCTGVIPPRQKLLSSFHWHGNQLVIPPLCMWSATSPDLHAKIIIAETADLVPDSNF